MTEPPTALGAWEAVVREWDVGFDGFTGGALPDGDRGRGVTVRLAEGGRWSPAVRRWGVDGQVRGSSLPGSANARVYPHM